ncbi:uncharacterized protein LY89DRAFT_451784 [Mollisia scopiformis]|uniref:Zn(2)-C6 fungal-type domain-containing protein n=1 Tax=Mollisia scopiformis TaxID=149040 RepID=A0A194XKL2_MOLSC|nr:uncharacterized protein LY89DRAFT_451784 [Mollisia scopiformis]KUJ20681.1 hypothetical protein LY89DRAFT_451784 [Mollisia scopiformis]
MDEAHKLKASQSISPKRKVRQKTFTGCWTCRSRKVKCDEGVPACNTCIKRGDRCSGYEPIYIWVKGYQDYPPGRRRVLRSDLTWRGHRIHQPIEVDSLIAQCNVENHDEAEEIEKSAGPFTVFCAPNVIPLSLSEVPNASHGNFRLVKELCHHYFTYTALNMMPFKDKRNPWRSFYPRMARQGSSRGQKSLYYAILAQAAGNLAHLGSRREEMLRLATQFYSDGVKHLRTSLGDMDFSAVIASIVTLIMAEVYAGLTTSWKVHLNGAWNFLMTCSDEKPWAISEEAWITAQSLCLVKIRADTMQEIHLRSTKDDETMRSLLSLIAYRDDFGFTAGAGPRLMRCIHDTTSLESKLWFKEPLVEKHETTIKELHRRIQQCQPEDPETNVLAKLHHEIFKIGALIHFHRRILNFHPRALLPYVTLMLDAIEQYLTLNGGYIALWPVFIGAVEVFEESHKSRVRTWLSRADLMGAANRKDVRLVIEAVWRERSRLSCVDEKTEGETVVDWREVIRDLGIEILLV